MNAVKYSLPPAAKKTYIHDGEEAQVRRLSCANPFFNGLVERKEPLGGYKRRSLSDPNSVTIGDCYIIWDSDSQKGQALRYYLLKLSHAFFPENFPEARALRFLEEDGKQFGTIYMEYIPDTTGCIGRRESYFKDIDALIADRESYPEQYLLFDALNMRKKKYDEEERRLCPQIDEFAPKNNELGITEKAGIIVIHPAANYHVRGGKPVFFEPYQFDYRTARAHAESLSGARREKALTYIGLICCSALSQAICYIRNKGELQAEWRKLEALVENKDGAFFRAFLKFVREGKDFAPAVTNKNVGYGPLNYVRAMHESLPAIMASGHSF